MKQCLGNSGTSRKGLNPALECRAGLSRGSGSQLGMIFPSVYGETNGNTLVVPTGGDGVGKRDAPGM